MLGDGGRDEIASLLETEGITLSSDIECGNASGGEVLGPRHMSVEPRDDGVPHEVQVTGPISCYNVCVLLHNEAECAQELVLDVRIPAWLREAGFGYFLEKPYLTRPEDSLDWTEVPRDRQDNRGEIVRLLVPLKSGERKVLSSVAHVPYSWCSDRLAALAEEHGDMARLVQIGLSAEGRPIYALETGPQSARPRAVFTGTLQPGEPAAWGVLAMAEAYLRDEEFRRYRESAAVDFVPQPNPDGIVRGLCNVNAEGRLTCFEFEEVANGWAAATETRLLWEYLAARPPSLLADFHFLTLPNHPFCKPYAFDFSLYKDPARAAAAERMLGRLCDLSGCRLEDSLRVAAHPMWGRLSTYQSIVQWDAVSFLYQCTGPTTSHHHAQTRGVEVLRVALEEWGPE